MTLTTEKSFRDFRPHAKPGYGKRACQFIDCAAGVAVGARACDRTAGSSIAAKPRVVAGGAVRSNAFGAAVGPVAGMLAPIARTLDHTAVGFRATVVVARAPVTLANDTAPGGAVVSASGITICTGACDQVT